jgi:hypothetical protein
METAESWATKSVEPAVFDTLAQTLPASKLWALLLEVLGQRATRRPAAEVLRQWMQDPFTQPSAVDQRTLVELDGHLLAAASAFEAIELSPLAPLAACVSMSPGSQHRIVSALRGTEVVADPTNLLALEAARRLRADPGATVRLATCHRCVRAQPVPKQPGFAQHFRLFALATAALEQSHEAFALAALVEQVRTHWAALDRLEGHGFAFRDRSIAVLTAAYRGDLGDRMAASLAPLPVTRGSLEHRYYHGIRFLISVRAPDGAMMPLIDGGMFDWLATLNANRRLRFVASGMGSQRVTSMFRSPAR